MAEICALLRYYPSYSGSYLPIGCPETSVRNCDYTMDNIHEERKFSPMKFLVTQFSSPSSYSHPPNSSTYILKQTHSLSMCNFSGFTEVLSLRTQVVYGTRLCFEDCFVRLQPLNSVCQIQPTCALSSNEQPYCN
jgi:hypothetical protein